MNISEIEAGIVAEFDAFDDWMEKYNYIIESGKSLVPFDPKFREDRYLIKGCQSQVWLRASMQENKVIYLADSDALITKGIASLLVRVLSNQTPDEIINAELRFIDATGLKEHLSQTRSNGLMNMINQMKLYARAFKAKQQI
ncbi:MAG TPA: SufE family protein [Bacteroidales bacterium]|nr:SufE family protein [Bacteroidales bacterium]